MNPYKACKVIKKLLKIGIVFLFLLVVILASGYVLLQHKGIQNRLAGYFMTVVSENLNTDFTVGNVDLAFPYRLRLRDIYLEDLHGDTLLSAKSITLGISRINPITKAIKVNAVNLNEAYFRLSSDSSYLLNIEFILERLRGKEDTTKTGWKIALNNIKLKNKLTNDSKKIIYMSIVYI